MNIQVVNYNHSQDTVVFVYNRLNPVEINRIIKNHRDGVETAGIDEKLKQGEYIPVLSAIWGERDKEKRLAWLRWHASERHAPLMYEQAIAEFVAAPAIETIVAICLPLIKAASFRVVQDMACSTDISVHQGDARDVMEKLYLDALAKAVQKYLSLDAKALNDHTSSRTEEIKKGADEKLKEIAQATFKEPDSFPQPGWVAFHGMDMFATGRPGVCNSADYARRRQEIVKQVFFKLNLPLDPSWN